LKILAIQWSICSSAALFCGNHIAAAVNEERFTRLKNDDSFPAQAIRYCLNSAGLNAKEIDGVAVCSLAGPYQGLLLRQATWSLEDYLKEQHEYWYPRIYQGVSPKRTDILAHKVDLEAYPPDYWKASFGQPGAEERFSADREQIAADFLGIERARVARIEHHRSHAVYSYYASPFRKEPVLALTVDGWGDWVNATIGIFDERGSYKRVHATDQCNIGRVYRYMTLLLGMKPNEHEYKVMGLAPYGREKYAQKALELFKSTLYVDGVDFKWKEVPPDSYFWFKERLEGVRFDNIAYALQVWVEDLLVDWTRNAIQKFGIRKVVFSGGVAMNIKAMGKIAQLPEVDSLFVGGSASDESLSLGSSICLAEDLENANGNSWDSASVESLPHLYLGPVPTREEERKTIEQVDLGQYKVMPVPGCEELARLLVSGRILARCVGRMEFGQRALGNRSILADPVNLRAKDRINAMIKSRDFWMPFAPVILDTYVSRYIRNPKGIESPHMTIGFETTPEGFEAMIAACHPADRSARPQILRKEANPPLYELLEAFAAVTGRGALLNTSFNLHGDPIVNTPQDAIYVLVNSGLDGVILQDHLVLKK
jgi:carbamoyltransferase